MITPSLTRSGTGNCLPEPGLSRPGRRSGPLIALASTAAVVFAVAGTAIVLAQDAGLGRSAVDARRFATNPLITVASSSTLGGNVNGPTVIRVPQWVQQPLGRYYMYFANHMGDFVRLAYSDDVTGPWTIYEPGVLHVRDTAFFRRQPDPTETLADFYTHVASPEMLVDPVRKRMVMWVHGWWTAGERWPANPAEARTWARQKGYGQFSQPAESADGLHFTVRGSITKTSYMRVFQRGGLYYAVSRLGLVSRTDDPLSTFQGGRNLFSGTRYANRVRHVALVVRGDRLEVFFTAIGDAPEHVLVSTVDLTADWTTWQAAAPVDVIEPQAAYECASLPDAPSEAGDIDVAARQIRDPFVFEEAGRSFLFYSTCGEQGIAGAEINLRSSAR
jgi:hypothetical protein